MKRLLAKLWLWRNHYCTKHLIKKTEYVMHGVWYTCDECEAERKIAHQNYVMATIKEARGQ